MLQYQEKRIKRLQRELSRKIKRSNNYYKCKNKLKLFFILKKSAKTEEIKIVCEKQLDLFTRRFANIFKVDVISEIETYFENVYKIAEGRKCVFRKNIQKESSVLHLQEQKKQIMINIMLGNINVSRRIMNNILENLNEDELEYKKQIVIEVFSEICGFLRQENRLIYENVQPFISYQSILNMSTNREIFIYCNRIFEKMRIKVEMDGDVEKNNLSIRVKNYINEHIYEDVLLEDIANELFVSTSHLSRIFKKQTGETFSQYVTKKKMDKAIELLGDSRNKAYQVGERLGYKTPRHFSKVFYNYTGYYPSQYRKQVLNMGLINDED